MYDFLMQEKMFSVAVLLLEKNNLGDHFCLGGGTALAAHYWQHRYSTDIDIFIFDKTKVLRGLMPYFWDEPFANMMSELGFEDKSRFPGHYLELSIDEDSKIQFFETKFMTKNPFVEAGVLNAENVKIETIDEIIAKKIYFRGDKGNARDLFDIAVAINKNPHVLSDIISGGKSNITPSWNSPHHNRRYLLK